jgi:hypothetical protein
MEIQGPGGRRFGDDQRRERHLVNKPLRVTAAMRSKHGNSHQAAARPVKHFGTQLLHAALCNNGDAT